jgi:hypothetical protein
MGLGFTGRWYGTMVRDEGTDESPDRSTVHCSQLGIASFNSVMDSVAHRHMVVMTGIFSELFYMF